MTKAGSKRNRRSRLRHDEIPFPHRHATASKGSIDVEEEGARRARLSRTPSQGLADDLLDADCCFATAERACNSSRHEECVDSVFRRDASTFIYEVHDAADANDSGMNLEALASDRFADEPHETGAVRENEIISPLMAQSLSSEEDFRNGTSDEHYRRERMSPSPTGNLVLSNWKVLWAFLMTNGSRKLTKEQYQSVRYLASVFASTNVVSWKTGTMAADHDSDQALCKKSVLPHYSTLDRLKHFVLDRLAPRAVEHSEIVDESKAGAHFESKSPSGEAKITLRTILPTEYARADMSSPAVWSEMRSTALSHGGCNEDWHSQENVSPRTSVDLVPVIRSRSWFYGHQRSMSVDSDSQVPSHSPSQYAEEGDIVRVRLLGVRNVSENVQRCFGGNVSQHSPLLCLQGVFSHSWTVHQVGRRNDPQFLEYYGYDVSRRDEELSGVFNFVEYRSPTDTVAVDIPAIPSGLPDPNHKEQMENNDTESFRKESSPEVEEYFRKRKVPGLENSQNMEAEWGELQKPLLKPGDFVVLLRPCDLSTQNPTGTLLTSVDKSSRLFIVHRFWSEGEERSRHAFFVSGGADISGDDFYSERRSFYQFCDPIDEESLQRYAYVRNVELLRTHGGLRGPEKQPPVSSIGVLDSGEPYFIYRVVLFWDGFNIHAGRSASGEGVYMLSLNLPEQARKSKNAVRILSLTPPGVKSVVVLRHILNDIVQAAADGVVDYDADGTKRRIFIDLVGLVGDTPALNSALDVLGHTANSCCHLCRFKRISSSEVGSKYATKEGNGGKSAFRRGYFQHAAVHDCGAQRETCRLLGIRSNPDIADLPFHAYTRALANVRNAIPTVSNGVPVIPYKFDPYKASFIAPDHLLTGLLRDCISLVLKLLPSERYLKASERATIALLTEIGLPRQNRLFDHSKRTIFIMSMTDLYALALVAEAGFRIGCSKEDGQGAKSISTDCELAIELVGSCSNLIAAIWRNPDINRDGFSAARDFDEKNGTSTILRIQRAVEDHLGKVQSLCTMADEDLEALQQGTGTKAQRAELTRLQRTAKVAIRCLDKPNLHRLHELAYTTLPMIGHVSLVGELVLEKAHQVLKRAIKQSNNKHGHILSMKSMAFDDWQGRMALAASGASFGHYRHILSCYRLLEGRESVERIQGILEPKLRDMVLRALGPGLCIRFELESQGKSVISPRSRSISTISWKLEGPVRRLPGESRPEDINKFDNYLRVAFGKDVVGNTVLISNAISSKLSTGLPGHCFRRGDVVETLCFNPRSTACHFPFLLQTNVSKGLDFLAQTSEPAIWYVRHIVQITDCNGRPLRGRAKFYIAVQPCILENTVRLQCFRRYRVNTNSEISFGQLDLSMRKAGVVRPSTAGRESQISAERDGIGTAGDVIFLAVTREMGYPPRQG